jgi:hypothetical protein
VNLTLTIVSNNLETFKMIVLSFVSFFALYRSDQLLMDHKRTPPHPIQHLVPWWYIEWTWPPVIKMIKYLKFSHCRFCSVSVDFIRPLSSTKGYGGRKVDIKPIMRVNGKYFFYLSTTDLLYWNIANHFYFLFLFFNIKNHYY